ncbi:hypothetical protein ONZ45_g8932 [Pleurotus djamor]|nr:hypothetical protein ONZ45_g8932 [Pleurotus djamor]
MTTFPAIVSIFTHLGSPLLIGTALASILYGIFVGQTIWYFRSFSNDRTLFKILLNVRDPILGICLFFDFDGSRRTKVRAISLFLKHLTLVHRSSAFTYRIWIMSQRTRLITGLLVFLTLLRFAASLGFNAAVALVDNAFTIHYPVCNGFGIVEMTSAAACDIITAIAMVCYLSKGRTEFPTRTQSLINKLIFYFVGIGALTSIFALAVLILVRLHPFTLFGPLELRLYYKWLALPHTLIFLIFHSVISKLYANSFMVTLNSRQSSRDEDTVEMSIIWESKGNW